MLDTLITSSKANTLSCAAPSIPKLVCSTHTTSKAQRAQGNKTHKGSWLCITPTNTKNKLTSSQQNHSKRHGAAMKHTRSVSWYPIPSNINRVTWSMDHSRNRPCAMMHGVSKATRCTRKSGVTKGPWKSRAPPRSCKQLVMQVTKNDAISAVLCVISHSWLHHHSSNYRDTTIAPTNSSCLANM